MAMETEMETGAEVTMGMAEVTMGMAEVTMGMAEVTMGMAEVTMGMAETAEMETMVMDVAKMA
jgi:hypothetical protein